MTRRSFGRKGSALYHHLKGEFALAIDHRKREIQLIERLHESLRESVSEGRYDENFASDILRTSGRDAVRLQERLDILRSLETERAINEDN